MDLDKPAPMSPSQRARLGGLAVSYDREHMAEIGRKGGLKVSEDRAHMAEIGRKGGSSMRGWARWRSPNTHDTTEGEHGG